MVNSDFSEKKNIYQYLWNMKFEKTALFTTT